MKLPLPELRRQDIFNFLSDVQVDDVGGDALAVEPLAAIHH